MLQLPDDIDLSGFPAHERAIIEEYLRRQALQSKGDSFLDYLQAIAPWFTIEEVHIAIAEKLEKVVSGEIDRLMLFIAPRTGKSQLASVFFPTYYIGKYPHHQIMQVGHSATMSEGFGREARNTIMTPEYAEIFPETQLSKDSRSVSAWATTKNGKYSTAGVDTGIAGKGYALGILDDLLNEKTAMSPSAKQNVWEWYGPGFYSRKMPRDPKTGRGSSIINIQCMTGDTPVLMADGTETPLRDICVGDVVATYDNGKLLTSHVMGHKLCGMDDVVEITTESGRKVRANARHPFLIYADGDVSWIQTKNLCPGQSMLKANMENGKGPPADGTAVTFPLCAEGIAANTTWPCAEKSPPLNTIQSTNEVSICGTATGLPPRSMTSCLRLKAGYARFVGHLRATMLERTGKTGFVSTIVTIRTWLEGCCATIATLLRGTPKPRKLRLRSQNISDFTLDRIVSIHPVGHLPVYDVQIYRTENFIANGLVSHNTRWAVDDLAGRLLAQQAINPDADKWDVLSIPAVLDEPSAELLTRISHDPKYAKYLPDTNRTFSVGDSFSPRRFPYEDLMRTKHGSTMSPRAWAALYLQSPVAEEGGLLRAEWWVKWPDKNPLPKFTYVFQSYDVASETAAHNDFTARTTWGIFRRSSDGRQCIMLLEYSLHKLDFPALLTNALACYKEYAPDRVVVEKASSGIPLYQEFRKRGIPVSPIKPQGTKYSRADAATIPLSQGIVYYPDRRWAQDLIDVCAAFPAGPEDDSVDSTSMALNFARRLFLLETPDDAEDDDEDTMASSTKRSYATRRSRLPVAA